MSLRYIFFLNGIIEIVAQLPPRSSELVMGVVGLGGRFSDKYLYIILCQIEIGCLVYKELDVKALDIIRCVTQGEKEIYCVELC